MFCAHKLDFQDTESIRVTFSWRPISIVGFSGYDIRHVVVVSFTSVYVSIGFLMSLSVWTLYYQCYV
jgi:hypothetical protein